MNYLTPLDYTVIALYILALAGLGIWVSRKKEAQQDLFLAGRSLGWKTIGLSIFGTNISPMAMISNCGLAFAYGMVASNFEWLAWVFILLLAMFFLPYYAGLRITTMPEFIRHRFGERSRNVLSWIIFIQISIGAGSVLFAGSLLVSQITGWPITGCIVLVALLAVSFTVMGGLKAVALTDSFQSLLMIGACGILTVVGFREVGGWGALWSQVPASHWHLFRPASDASYPWYAIVLGYPVMGVWYWCANQTIVQNALGGKNLREGQRGVLFASYLKVLIPVIFLLPGILCAALHPDLKHPDEAFMTMVVNYLPHGLIGLVISALVAALISTITSMFNSGSTVFTLDIYKKHVNPDLSPEQSVRVGRWSMGGLCALAMLIAFGQSAIVGLSLFEIVNSIFSFLAPSLTVVFLTGVFWKRATGQAAFYTLALGNIPSLLIGLGYLSHYPSRAFYPHFLLISFFLFIALLLFMIVVSLLTAPAPEEAGFPTLPQAYQRAGYTPSESKDVWLGWALLALVMISLYVYFN